MRVCVLAALLVAVAPLVGCSSAQNSSSQSTVSQSRGSTQGFSKPEPRVLPVERLSALNVEALNKKDGERVVVQGKVYSTHLARSGKVFMLDLGPNWKTCFKAVVFQDDFEKWKGGTAGIKSSYEGSVVLIEGTIKLYQGSAEIVLSSPAQIESVPEGTP